MVIPKEKIMRSTILLFPLILWACSEKESDNPSTEQSSYENNNEQGFDKEEEYGEDKEDGEYSEDKEEEYSDEDKDGEETEKFDYEECASDIDFNASCEGTWEESICTMNDLIWWCQDGIWMSENDK